MVHTELLSGEGGFAATWRRELRAAAALIAFSAVMAIAMPSSAHAQLRESAAKLIAHTMGNPEFRVKSFRGGTWLGNGDAYLDLEPSEIGRASCRESVSIGVVVVSLRMEIRVR